MIIDRMEVTISPSFHRDGTTELEITVRAGGQKFSVRDILRPDDLQPMFDRYLDRAKHYLREEMKKHEAQEDAAWAAAATDAEASGYVGTEKAEVLLRKAT